jgi:hypothetical protein
VRRVRVGLIVAAGCLLMAAGLILTAGHYDEAEEVLRQHGPVSRYYLRGTFLGTTGKFLTDHSSSVSDAVLDELSLADADPRRSVLVRDLRLVGWGRVVAGPRGFSLEREDEAAQPVFFYPTSGESTRVVYGRPATEGERRLHGLKRGLGIEGPVNAGTGGVRH